MSSKEIIYCINSDCPFKKCKHHLSKLKRRKGFANFASLDGVCRDYIGYLVNQISNKSINEVQ